MQDERRAAPLEKVQQGRKGSGSELGVSGGKQNIAMEERGSEEMKE